jgi:hypothetical protein
MCLTHHSSELPRYVPRVPCGLYAAIETLVSAGKRAYTLYYNQARTHLALQKDAPLHRAVQRSGVIVGIPILGGLHHQYVQI